MGTPIAIRTNHLAVRTGGIFHTALNTPLFKTLWRDIFEHRPHHNYKWIIQVDVDTAFSPRAVHDILAKYTDDDMIYIDDSLPSKPAWSPVKIRGPIEIISRLA